MTSINRPTYSHRLELTAELFGDELCTYLGYFRMIRGVNDCNLESEIVGGIMDVQTAQYATVSFLNKVTAFLTHGSIPHDTAHQFW